MNKKQPCTGYAGNTGLYKVDEKMRIVGKGAIGRRAESINFSVLFRFS